VLCALTVRQLKPGSFDQFVAAFAPSEADGPPAGWVRFNLLRDTAAPDRVVTFGFFDGTLEQLERSQADADFESRRAAIDPLVDAVIANGVYEIVETLVIDDATAS
jgi:heme-degrading monooxygenase HmoA